MFLSVKEIQDKLRAWGDNLENVPVLGKLILKSRKLTLPGFQHMPVYDVMGFFAQSMSKGVIFQRAAALTYRVFIALVPMIIALFSAIAFLGENVQQELISLLHSLIPTYAWPAVADIITGVVTVQNGTLSTLMLTFGIYFGVLCSNGLLAALDTSYFNVQKRSFIRQLWLSFVIMVVGFFAIILILGLLIFSSVLLDFIHNRLGTPIRGYFFLVHGIKWILVFAALYFLVSALYYIAPVQKSNYRFFSAGSSMCTISLVVILWALNFYFSHFSNYNLIYGSLGALFAILLWINWSSLALLVGFDLNVSIAKAKDEGVERIESTKIQDP